MARRRCLFSTRLQGILSGVSYDEALAIPPYEASTGACVVTIVSNRQWTIDQTGLPNWVTLSTTAGTKGKTELTVTVTENITTSERTAQFLVRTKNNTKTLVITLSQKYYSVDLYLYSISTAVRQRVDVDYSANGTTGHVTFNTIDYPGAYAGTYPEGTIFSYTASTAGYYDTINSFTIRDSGHDGREDHIISFTANTTDDSFSINNVIYSGNSTYDTGMIEDRWMPEETFFTSAGTPLRAALVQFVKEDNSMWVGDYWRARDPKAEFVTNIPIGSIKVSATHISGGTEWLKFLSDGNKHILDPNSWKLTYTGSGGAGYSAWTLEIETAADVAYEKTSGETVHVANLNFYNARKNDELLAILPVVTETRQDDVVRIYPHNNPTSGKNGELYVNAPASSGFTEIDVLTSRILRFYPIGQGDEYIFSAISMYDQTEVNQISQIYPTIISGTNGTIQFANSGKFYLKIKRPSNPSYNSTKKYGTYMMMENFNHQVLDKIYGYVYITQTQNRNLYTDFEISGFSLSFISGASVTTSDSAITIPSSSVTYERPSRGGIQTNLTIACRYYSEDGSMNYPGYVYQDYIIPDGGGSTPDTNKLTVEYPQWLYLANGTGGTPSEHSPSSYIPYVFNAYANQSTASTGNARVGDVTVRWHYGTIKDGGDTAKTVTVTQPWSRLPLKYAAYISSLNGTSVGSNVITTSTTITAGGSVDFKLSGAAGTEIVFSNYAGDANLRNNLGITIGGQTITQSAPTYTFQSNGEVSGTITDKRYTTTYNFTLQMDSTSVPSGFAMVNLRLQIAK